METDKRIKQHEEAHRLVSEAGIPEAAIDRYTERLRNRGWRRDARLMAEVTLCEILKDIEYAGGKVTWEV